MTLPIGSISGTLRLLGAAEFQSGIVGAQRSMDLASGSAAKMAGAVNESEAAMTRSAAQAAKLRALDLSLTAAEERHTAAVMSGNASTAKLASTEAAELRARIRLSEATNASTRSIAAMGTASTTAAAEASTLRTGLASTIETAGKLGLAFGAFELIKKAIDIGKEANQYQAQMTQIETLTGAGADEMQRMTKAVLAMSGEVATAPDDLAVSLYHVEQNGLRGAQALNVVATAAKGAKIGMADVEDTTNSMTSAVASGIPGVQNMDQAMGALLATVGTGDMKMSDLNDALGNGILSVAKTYGLSLKDVGASLATFGDLNIRGQDAASQLRQAIMAFAKPAVGPAAAAMLDKLGMSTKTLAVDMQHGGLNQAVTDLRSRLHAAGVEGDQTGKALLDLFGKKAGIGVSILVDQYDRLQTKYAELAKGSESFASKWEQTNQTAKVSFERLGAEAKSEAITFEQRVMPAVTKVSDLIATGLPEALNVGKDALAPFVAAWDVVHVPVEATAHAVDDVAHSLGPVAPVLKGTAVAALSMWLAFKGYTIATAAVGAIRGEMAGLALSARANVGAVGSAWRTMGLVASGGATEAAIAAKTMQADMLAIGAAAQAEAVKVDAAKLSEAEAYAAWVSEFEDANAAMIAGSANAALAAREQAAVSASAYESTAAAATAAAAELDAAGAAAAVGWRAVLGPLALVAIGVSTVAMMFGHSSRAAEQNAQDIRTLTQAIIANSGALTGNVRAQVAAALESNGALDAARKLGIALPLVTDAALDQAPALAQVNSQLRVQADAIIASYQAGKISRAQMDSQLEPINKLNDELKNQASNTNSAVRAAKNQTAASKVDADATAANTIAKKQQNMVLGWLVTTHGNLVQAEHKAGSALADGTAAMKAQTTASTLLGNALGILNGVAESVETSTDSFNVALLQLKNGSALAKDSNNDLVKSLSRGTVAGNQNRQTLVSLIDAAKAQAQAVADNVAAKRGETAGLVSGNKALKANEDRIRAAAQAAGLDTKQVDGLIASIGKLSHVKAAPKVSVDVSAAKTAIAELHTWLNGLHNKTITVTEYSHLMQQTGHGNLSGHAAGGTVVGQGGPTSDSVVARLSPGEEVIRASQAEKHRGLLKAINAGTDGFASGGTVGVGVAGHLSGVNAQGAAQVVSAIMAAIRPAPSTAAGIAGQLLRQEGGATSRNIAADSALAAYRKEAAALKAVTKATDEQVAAAKHEATQAGITARKAKQAAEAMPSATKAERAAKSAAEDHARALQHLADKAGNVATKVGKAAAKEQAAAQATADKGKAAYSKLEAAAKAATQVAAQTAQNLVASIQSQFDTLQQNYDDMKSTISGGLTAGSDLSTIWGQLGDTVSTTSDALDQAQQALRSAQDAVAQATPDMSALADAQSAAASAASQLAAAQRDVAAANSSGDTARIVSAQNELTAAMTASTSAHAALVQAQSGAASQSGPTVDQLQAVADAQDKLTAAQQAYTAAKAADSASGVASVLSGFDDSEKQFAGDLTHLKSMIGDGPAAQALITELTGLGDKAGDALAEGLINDPASLRSILASMQQIQSIADGEGTALATSFYASGAQSMMQLMQGIEDEYPSVAAGLAPYAAQLAQMFNIPMPTPPSSAASGAAGKSVTHAADIASYYLVNDTANGKWYDVNPTAKTVHELTDAQKQRDIAAGATVNTRTSGIPHFAAGVTDFAGGLAMVHRDELLVNLPRGTDVVPANRAKAGAFGAADPAVLQRLAAIEAHSAATSRKLDAIASLPVIGQAAGQALRDANHLYGALELAGVQ